ncbi:hypothetical protein C488_02840 [Natrinema pellirubrum DSM 15624]|uniref:DUF7973 domain-containing protein n=1 Tax=Natrinema pellirubrum (strain DSM 15624 / CIP 106293 / JCM 10476 / NCIMB 786 / 157) TaxID=797303 RepID=L0JKP1_NATP1|nr:hypothetical protein [Natrinema pellirubrum]AGB30926.1 hypothetical protein Natpe_1014 [Natrinema pellirubrum DSM 15624]ELY80690.1 hypothetical protein C488_02840 [Natrinema pellirubrum DSM 15624]
MLQPLVTVPIVGMELEAFAVLLIAALAGGAFGAALGALPSFVFTGFVVFLGEGIAILQDEIGSEIGVAGAGDIATGITGTIGFGAVTGPHIAFAGGVAATAYAGRTYPEMEPNDWDYHFGKDILYAFGTKPDILAVGAVFGAVGMLITRVMGGLGFPTDNIALSVVATAFLARLAFGYPIVGKVGGSSVLDMSPFEREEKRMAADGGTETDRLATEPWLPHQYKWSGVTAIGIVGGLLGGYIWLETGSYFMGYAISAMSLLFLNLGVEKIPVTHHITLLGTVGAVIAMPAMGSELVALLAAGAFGAISGLLGEVSQRVFYSHSGTHVDPPAMAIAEFMLVLGVLYLVGLLPNAGYLSL